MLTATYSWVLAVVTGEHRIAHVIEFPAGPQFIAVNHERLVRMKPEEVIWPITENLSQLFG